MDLRDLWRPGGLTWRRLGLVIDKLPIESATKTAMRDALTPQQLAAMAEPLETPVHGPWSRVEMLLARNGDLLAHLIWMQTDGKTKPPRPLTRPGVEPLESSTYMTEELREDARAYVAAYEAARQAALGDAEEVTPDG